MGEGGLLQFAPPCLTRATCNRIVTHYASPNGYIFNRRCLRRTPRSNAPGRSRSPPAGKASRRPDCSILFHLPASHLETSALAPTRLFGSGTSVGPQPHLPTESGSPAHRRFLVEPVPRLLGSQPLAFEGICGDRGCPRSFQNPGKKTKEKIDGRIDHGGNTKSTLSRRDRQ